MTIVAGFVSTDGLLLCADREERDGTSKKEVNKVLCLAGDDWHVAIGGAGPSAIIELAFKRLRKRFESVEDEAGIQSEHEEILRNELFNLHEEYVWPSKQVDYRFSLLVGINLKRSKQTFLYRTQEYIPEPIQTFCCIGIGADLANYFAERLYNVSINKTEAILIATFIMREVRDFVTDCGKGTQMELFLTGGRHFSLPPETFWELDQELPDFRNFLNDFWSRQWNFTHRALEAWSRGEIYDGPTTVRHQKIRRELKFKPSISETSKPKP